ncbi:hypothetical protein ABZY93_11065 [Streptomyces smyrnaeus]|uniref:hypothetical protein n=1 Tax=Streptomyces smyrnaeus TaxID=1387713 RepID=UPI0033ADEB3C
MPEKKNTKVIKVLQQANDWRKKHPESIALTAKILHLSEAQAKSDASHVETLSTGELVARTESGEMGRWLKKLGDFFLRNEQLEKNPDPADYYTGALYRKVHSQ